MSGRTARILLAPSGFLLAIIASLAVALAYWAYWTLFPTVTAGVAGNDALFLADGARRIAAGEIPHVDFSLPTGVEPYLGYYLAERFLPALAPYIGSQLFGFLLLVPVLAAGMARMPNRALALALLGLTAACALLPFNTTVEAEGLAFYASYNRLGSALALAYLAFIFRTEDDGSPVGLGLLIGYALLVAFFLKIVLFGVIVGPVVVLAVFSRRWRYAGLVALALFAAVLALVQWHTGMVAAYIGDIHTMSVVNTGGVLYYFSSFVFKTLFPLTLFAALTLWWLWERFTATRNLGASFGATLSALARPVAMMAAVVGLIAAEGQSSGGLGLSGALGLLFAAGIAGPRPTLQRLLLIGACAAILVGSLVTAAIDDGGAILLQRAGKLESVAWASPFMPHTSVPASLVDGAVEAAALWDQIPGDNINLVDRTNAHLYLAQWKSVTDAIAAMPQHDVASLGSVTTLANVDLFGLALKAKPTKGIEVVVDVGRTLKPMTDQQASTYLKNADTVFEPTCLLDQAPRDGSMFAAWFSKTLATQFSSTPLTPCWTMHRRTSPA